MNANRSAFCRAVIIIFSPWPRMVRPGFISLDPLNLSDVSYPISTKISNIFVDIPKDEFEYGSFDQQQVVI